MNCFRCHKKMAFQNRQLDTRYFRCLKCGMETRARDGEARQDFINGVPEIVARHRGS